MRFVKTIELPENVLDAAQEGKVTLNIPTGQWVSIGNSKGRWIGVDVNTNVIWIKWLNPGNSKTFKGSVNAFKGVIAW